MSAVIHSFSGKKRYGCSDCKWRGWRRPLARRGHAKPRPILHREVNPSTSALVIVASILIVALVSLEFGCNPTTRENTTNGPLGVANPLW